MKNKFYTVIIALFLSSNSLIAYVQIDEIAPDFQLKNSFGDNVSLSDYRGKRSYLNGPIMVVHLLPNITQREICNQLRTMQGILVQYG